MREVNFLHHGPKNRTKLVKADFRNARIIKKFKISVILSFLP